MSEPKAVASRLEEVVEGVHFWSISDERIGGMMSCSTAVEETPGSIVLIDPVRLEDRELERLGHVAAILVTNQRHLRSAPHYRDVTGAALWAPAAATFEDAEPDETFTDGNELPGGLAVISIPGPSDSEHALFLRRASGVVIVGDAVLNLEGPGGFSILPEEYNPNLDKTRESCRKLLDYPFQTMLFGHGRPITEGARDKLRALLES